MIVEEKDFVEKAAQSEVESQMGTAEELLVPSRKCPNSALTLPHPCLNCAPSVLLPEVFLFKIVIMIQKYCPN